MVVSAGRNVRPDEIAPEGAPAQPNTGARILAAAQELALKRGFRGVSVATIAEKALVGKGTVYLYWKTKEELFLTLLARSFLTIVDELIDALAADADLVLPHRFCLSLLRASADHPLVHALQTHDVDILGSLAQDDRTFHLVRRYGAAALYETLLPIWRSCGLASQSMDPIRQADALQMLSIGYAEMANRSVRTATRPSDWRDETMNFAVARVLGAPDASSAQLAAAANEALGALRAFRLALSAQASASPDRDTKP